MRPCGALESCCPLQNADVASPSHQPNELVSKTDLGQACHPSYLKDWAGREQVQCLPGQQNEILSQKVQGPAFDMQYRQKTELGSLGCSVHSSPVSGISWEAKGNLSPDNLEMAAHWQYLSWLLVGLLLNTILLVPPSSSWWEPRHLTRSVASAGLLPFALNTGCHLFPPHPSFLHILSLYILWVALKRD